MYQIATGHCMFGLRSVGVRGWFEADASVFFFLFSIICLVGHIFQILLAGCQG